MYYDWRPYVSQADRKAMAAKHAKKLEKKGKTVRPVTVEGRAIAKSFWGKAWCDHLESYSDFANRLPRGRTYVRNGSVFHLEVNPGRVDALVSGSEVYEVEVEVKPLAQKRWDAVVKACAGQIGSVVALLQGKLPPKVLEAMADRDSGLFPAPKEIAFKCSCPDSAYMCKHVAAVLYGIGAQLDESPEIFFELREVDARELLTKHVSAKALATEAPEAALGEGELEAVFGIELDDAPKAAPPRRPKAKVASKPAARRARAPAEAKTTSAKKPPAKAPKAAERARSTDPTRARGRGGRNAP